MAELVQRFDAVSIAELRAMTNLLSTPGHLGSAGSSFVARGVDVDGDRLLLTNEVQLAEHVPSPASECDLAAFCAHVHAFCQVRQWDRSEIRKPGC
jgi:hypothetical protein